jgi:hypothetical protein
MDRETDKLLAPGKLGQVGNIRLAEFTAIAREKYSVTPLELGTYNYTELNPLQQRLWVNTFLIL